MTSNPICSSLSIMACCKSGSSSTINAMRLIIAEFKSPTRYKVVERVRMPVRLGASVFKTNRIVAHKVCFHRAKRGFGGFSTSAHFSKTNEPVIRFDFDDRPNKSSPVHAVGVAQWRFQGNGNGCRTDVCDFHYVYRRNNISEPFAAAAVERQMA